MEFDNLENKTIENEEENEEEYEDDFEQSDNEQNNFNFEKYEDELQNLSIDLSISLSDAIKNDAIPVGEYLKIRDIYLWLDSNKLITLNKLNYSDDTEEENNTSDDIDTM